ncbi:MAG: iron export ABC transporter permease subunit FetB [Peptoniphilaceae bacterium]|nr:iron export ABC transporter permease subunit FetB [Peptoniphilaceae bacterium]
MNKGIINLSNQQLALTYILVAVVLIVTSLNGINRKKDILISIIRMTIQLFIAGLVLVYIIDTKSFIFPLAMFLIMEFFAIFNVIKNVKTKIPKGIKKVIGLSIFTGTSLSLLFFLVIVIQVKPFYSPQYLIPLGGMIIGNSMTGVNLALVTLLENLKNRREEVEASLMLGASPKDAINNILEVSFDTAFLPTLNSMKNMGIISLPGMMTGQILSGTSPMIAIKYQIAIMIAILASVCICVFLFLYLSYKNFFNKDDQLIF